MKITKLIDAKAFAKMNKFRKRVAIAKDVLMRIEKKNIKPNNGTFGEIWGYGCSLQEAINSESRCEVCAKGALALSWVGNFNEYDEFNRFNENLNYKNAYPEELLKIFGRNLLDAIEIAFEGKRFSWHTEDISREEKDAIEEYACSFSNNSTDRMVAVFKNIVKNKGKLVCGDVVIE